MDTSGLLQDSAPPAGRFRPYASTKHRVTRGRYITSNDPRGYIPVYEYPLNGQWIMMDTDDGYILWTGIWKALGNAKADIVKMLESQPELAPQLRRVRGGYLKIQGTWMPYEVALRLARRVAWPIREDLIPLFGPTFPSTCLTPEQPGYGQILGTQHGRRRGRRTAVALPLPATLPPPQTSEFEPSPALGSAGQQTQQRVIHRSATLARFTGAAQENQASQSSSPSQIAGPSGISRGEEQHDFDRNVRDGLRNVRYPYPPVSYDMRSSGLVEPQGLSVYALGHGQVMSQMPPPPAPSSYNRSGPSTGQAPHSNTPIPGPIREHRRQSSGQGFGPRFSPYGSPGAERRRSSSSAALHLPGASPMDLPPLSIPPSRARSASGFGSALFRQRLAEPDIAGLASVSNSGGASTSVSTTSLGEDIVLPAIHGYDNAVVSPSASRERSGSLRSTGSGSGYSLPPISALDEPPPSQSSEGSPGRLNSAVVLKRLTLDDEILGRARQRNFADILEEEVAHGNDREAHVPPTHEQLWTRRRSLSAPPLNPDFFPKPRTAWSAAPNIKLNIPSSGVQVNTRPRSSSSTYNRSPLSYGEGGGVAAEGSALAGGRRGFHQDSPTDDRSTRNYDGPRGFTSMGRNLLSPNDGGRQDAVQPSPSRITSNDGIQEANFAFSYSPKQMQGGDVETSTSKSSSSTEKGNGGLTPRQPANYLPSETPRSGSSPRTATPSGALARPLSSPRTNSRVPPLTGSSLHTSADLVSYRFGGEGQTALYSRSPSPFNRQKEPDHVPMDVEVDRTSYFHSSGRDRGTPSR